MKIIATSDLHGELPTIPECDLLLIGGDICPDGPDGFQTNWLGGPFKRWLEQIPAREVVGIAGNHDFCFQRHLAIIKGLQLRWKYLQDESVCVDGLWIYGTPWTPRFGPWAFMNSDEELGRYFDNIKNVDILLSHGPAYGVLDEVGDGHAGSKELLKHLHKTKVFICGHIHEGFGSDLFGSTICFNVSRNVVNIRT